MHTQLVYDICVFLAKQCVKIKTNQKTGFSMLGDYHKSPL